MKKILSLVLVLCMILASVCSLAVSVSATETGTEGEISGRYTVSGMSAIVSKNIMLGTIDTGAIHTQIALPSGSTYNPYSTDSVINVIEVAPNQGLTFAALNNGSYNWSKTTMGKAAIKYNETHTGTIIAATNGDPWLVHHTDYDGDGAKASGAGVKHGSVSRGLLIVDGEMYNSPLTNAESYLAAKDGGSGAEYSVGGGGGPVFAVKADGTFMIGQPSFSFSLKNTSTSTNLTAPTGINRLPAPNSIMIYNHRVGTESMAYTDAYEIYLESEDVAFGIGKTVKGTVTHIFESDSTETRPEIGPNTIIISARGNKVSSVNGKFKIGDVVSIGVSIRNDSFGAAQKAEWAGVTQAIGGFFTQMHAGTITGQPNETSAYPCSLIGVTQDGRAMMLSVTSQEDVRHGTRMQHLGKICKELGLYTVVMFDGGGSTEMITYEEGAYIRRTGCADGNNSVRAVINGLALVYEGADMTATNQETVGIGLYEGVKKENLETFAAVVNHVNGVGTDGTADTDFASVLISNHDILSSAELPITLKGATLSVNGWFVSNEGQTDEIKWSLDGGKTWFGECTVDEWLDGTDDHVAAAAALGVQNPSAEHAIFIGATADLSEYKGRTVSVTFGRTAYWGGTMPFATITNVKIPGFANPDADVAFTADRISSYRYYATVTSINGTATSLTGYRDHSTGLTERIFPASTTGITVDENRCITVSGMAQANGGQAGYYWSTDLKTWCNFSGGEYGEATAEFVSEASSSLAQLSSSKKANGSFTDLVIDLSPHAGKTVNVYLAVTPSGNGKGPCHFLTIENVSVPAIHTCTPGDQATCTEAQYCTECADTVAPALGHDIKQYEAQAPTCTAVGWEAYEACERCDYTTYAEVAILDHTPVAIPAVDATCTTVGSTAGEICSVCETVLTAPEEVPATGHTSEIIPAVDATCTTAGATEGAKCSVCGETLTAPTEIPMTGHIYDGDTDADCNACGETREITTEEPSEPATEEPTETPTEEPTEEPTKESTEEPVEEPTEDATETPTQATDNSSAPAEGGCGASLSVGLIGFVTALAAGFVFSKKRR